MTNTKLLLTMEVDLDETLAAPMLVVADNMAESPHQRTRAACGEMIRTSVMALVAAGKAEISAVELEEVTRYGV